MHERFQRFFRPRGPASTRVVTHAEAEAEIARRAEARALAQEVGEVAGKKRFLAAYREALRYEIDRTGTQPEAGIEARAAGAFKADGLRAALQVFDAMIEEVPDGQGS